MGMGHSKHLTGPPPRPPLSCDLFPGIDCKTAAALNRVSWTFSVPPPGIAAGPDRGKSPWGGEVPLSDQQGTAFLGMHDPETTLENIQASVIRHQQRWRERHDTDTLCRHL